MRRKGRGSTGRRPSTFKQASASQLRSTWQRAPATTRPSTPRRAPARHESNAVRSRRTRGRVFDIPERSRNIESPRRTDNKLHHRPLNRRTRVRPSRANAARGLPGGILSLRRYNEHAPHKEATLSVCTRTKKARRAVIISNGYGGINGFKNYKQHQRC